MKRGFTVYIPSMPQITPWWFETFIGAYQFKDCLLWQGVNARMK